MTTFEKTGTAVVSQPPSPSLEILQLQTAILQHDARIRKLEDLMDNQPSSLWKTILSWIGI